MWTGNDIYILDSDRTVVYTGQGMAPINRMWPGNDTYIYIYRAWTGNDTYTYNTYTGCGQGMAHIQGVDRE